MMRGWLLVAMLGGGCIADVDILGGDDTPDSLAAGSGSATKDTSGFGDTFVASGTLDTSNPFFSSLGTNGRSCVNCHQQAQGWSITPAGVKAVFDATNGTDPLFRTNDGTVSPTADVSTLAARKTAYAMLISKGLIRVGIGIPANAEFTLDAVDDPYHYANAADLSLFRRPLPSTNLPFLATVMWDGRETISTSDMSSNFVHQATDATLGHAQATATNAAQMQSIMQLETGLFTTQTIDNRAGSLSAAGAKGGPQNLANEAFAIGLNDPLQPNFNPNAMTLYNTWKPPAQQAADNVSQGRYAIYRGQQLFNTKPIAITGVAGLNDALGQTTIMGTCTTCHNTPNVGNHSSSLPINIGIADASRRTADMPLYTLRNKVTGATVQTTDPGRALITGRWADIGKFKGPVLRGLQLRAPYFHNGSAATLADVVAFYNSRFNMNLTAAEKADLVAFLQAL